uniref:U1 small nuclear ribonucleoprotein 70 kDa n=1 Tax=Timema cristinae TaxID=61476 RepID=A0A7R9CYP2_TIMCR|nr:unnamed protein product [Timema cristinae]
MERRRTWPQERRRDELRDFRKRGETSDVVSKEERRATWPQEERRDEQRGLRKRGETSDVASGGEERRATWPQEGEETRGKIIYEDPKDTPPPTRVETREERLERRRRERAEQVAYKLEQEIAVWDPHSLPLATADPFKTLFVARINFDTSESKLRREFEVYGPIKKIVVTHNTVNGKPRGYAFIEYEHERDMHSAYKHADGKKIDGRRVLVDVERARTVKGWLPRRLDPIFCPSMLCDPRFRGVLIDDMVAVNTLAIEVKKLSDKSSLEPNVRDEQPSCSSSSSGLWSSFDSIPHTTQPSIDNNSEGKDYLNEPRVPRSTNPYIWWREEGGGLGGTRRGGPDVNIKHSGREDNERERERYRLEREREAARGAPERNADRDRDRRRSRSRERERLEREKRRKSRSRSRERKRRRSRERVKEKDPDIEEIERVERPPPRDRDRDRDRKRRRSRSRDRGAERDRERGDRDRKRERRDRDRGGEKGEREKERRPRSEEKDVRIKLEPPDDYPDYSNTNYEENYEESNVKYEQGEENYNEASGEAEPNGRYEADY